MAVLGIAVLSLGKTARAQAGSSTFSASSCSKIASSDKEPLHLSAKHIREADDAYVEGARQFSRRRFEAARSSFQRAVRLNPSNCDYPLALLLTTETLLTKHVEDASRARMQGDANRANALLAEARTLDPSNPIVMQHFEEGRPPILAPLRQRASMSSLAGPIRFAPEAGERSFYLKGNLQDVIRSVYTAFGIMVTFDPTFKFEGPVRFDVDDVDFSHATRILQKMSGTFGVPIQPTTALIAKDTKENRNTLTPLVEQTIYLPGQSQERMTELANVARNVFDLSEVAVSTSSGSVVLRGDEDSLKLITNAYQDLIDNQSDVLVDVTVYEVDKTNEHDIGFSPPTKISAIDVASAAQSLISSNQTLLNSAISSGSLTLSGSSYQEELEEVEYLVAAGVSGSSAFTSLLGTLGSYRGSPLAGISVGSATLNFLLSSTEVRILDAIQLRAGNSETATFRVGSRYPILTSLTTATSSTAVTTALEAAGVSSSVAEKLGGSGSTTTVPQIQFEDLGITLKITPSVADDSNVRLALDFKIEAIGGTGVDSVPILNDRALASTVTVLAGETTMLATLVSTNETKLLDGVPDLNDLPGFQSTDRSTNGSKNELLITVTPHIVHTGLMRVTDHLLAVPSSGTDGNAPSVDP